jgi:hypothetical protein
VDKKTILTKLISFLNELRVIYNRRDKIEVAKTMKSFRFISRRFNLPPNIIIQNVIKFSQENFY